MGGIGAHIGNNKVQQTKEVLAEKKEKELSGKIGELLEGNEKLNSKIEPFEDLAHKLYPAIERAEALDKLRTDFENIRKKQKQLEQAAAPRVINSNQTASLINGLAKYKGESITIAVMTQENEAMMLANQFLEIFKKAGWKVTHSQSMGMQPVNGLMLVTPDNPPKQYQLDVLNIVVNAGIKIEPICHPPQDCNKKNDRDNEFRIIIGAKQRA